MKTAVILTSIAMAITPMNDEINELKYHSVNISDVCRHVFDITSRDLCFMLYALTVNITYILSWVPPLKVV